MAEFPAIPLWTDSYLADTRHLTTLEHGAYLLLLMEAWRRPECSLPDDDRLLARLAGLSVDEWASIKNLIMGFWKLDGRSKTWTQKKLSKERVYVADRSAKQRDRAAKRWNETKKEDAAAMPDGCRNDAPTPTPTPTPTLKKKEPPAESPKKRAHRLPADFSPDLNIAIEEGLQPQAAILSLARFKDHAEANGRTQIDWMASWRLWYRNDIAKQSQPRGSPSRAEPRPHPVIEELDRRRDLRNAEPNHSRIIDHER